MLVKGAALSAGVRSVLLEFVGLAVSLAVNGCMAVWGCSRRDLQKQHLGLPGGESRAPRSQLVTRRSTGR